MSNIFIATLHALKLPVKLLAGLVRKKSKRFKKSELEQKQLVHVRNFDPTRLNNRTCQKSSGKYKNKKKNKRK